GGTGRGEGGTTGRTGRARRSLGHGPWRKGETGPSARAGPRSRTRPVSAVCSDGLVAAPLRTAVPQHGPGAPHDQEQREDGGGVARQRLHDLVAGEPFITLEKGEGSTEQLNGGHGIPLPGDRHMRNGRHARGACGRADVGTARRPSASADGRGVRWGGRKAEEEVCASPLLRVGVRRAREPAFVDAGRAWTVRGRTAVALLAEVARSLGE